MAEENKQYENLPEFLNEFAGALQKLYPDKEKFYPIDETNHEGFADLISPDKYENLKEENIVEGVTIFGKNGSAKMERPQPTFENSSSKGYVVSRCDGKSSTARVMSVKYGSLASPSTSEYVLPYSIRYGTELFGYAGQYLGTIPISVSIIKDTSTATYETSCTSFPDESQVTYKTPIANFKTYVGGIITIKGKVSLKSAYVTTADNGTKYALPIGRIVEEDGYTVTWNILIPPSTYTYESVTIQLV